MSYVLSHQPVGLTADEESKLDLVLKNQAREAQARKLAITWGVIGALFAAARLGVVALPLIKERKR